MVNNPNQILIFDTTMREIELIPGVTMKLEAKIKLAQRSLSRRFRSSSS